MPPIPYVMENLRSVYVHYTLGTVHRQVVNPHKDVLGTLYKLYTGHSTAAVLYFLLDYDVLGGDFMPISDARRRANEKYNAKAYEEIKIRVKRGRKTEIQQAADRSGESLNGFINHAIDDAIDRLSAEDDGRSNETVPE